MYLNETTFDGTTVNLGEQIQVPEVLVEILGGYLPEVSRDLLWVLNYLTCTD